MMPLTSKPVKSLYVHVPFCAHKCEYCAFFSEAGQGGLISRYVSALVRELEMVAHETCPATVFFGGGTPSLLNLRQWGQVLTAFDRLGLLGAAEWTVECNPATVSLDKAKLLRDHGVNRISMGVQSLDEHLLDRLGRVHSREMVFKSYDILREAGFENINLDLMFAIPTQTMEVWQATLRETIALGSEHLSCYEVIYEEDTPLFEQLKAGEIDVNDELAAAMYEELRNVSAENGYVQYEVANFARNKPAQGEVPERIQKLAQTGSGLPGAGDPLIPLYACRHNVAYWRGVDYHGLGPSATGYVDGVRTKNWSNTQLYCDQLEKGQRAFESREELPDLKRAGEAAAFGLRMTAGWPLEEFRQRTAHDLSADWAKEIDQLVKLGYAQLERDRFRLTPVGLRYADWAAELFLR
jgi:oxygen-independent coproporphyrinogen-3 oxidase